MAELSKGTTRISVTREEAKALRWTLDSFVLPMLKTVGERITDEGRERRDALESFRAKLAKRHAGDANA